MALVSLRSASAGHIVVEHLRRPVCARRASRPERSFLPVLDFLSVTVVMVGVALLAVSLAVAAFSYCAKPTASSGEPTVA